MRDESAGWVVTGVGWDMGGHMINLTVSGVVGDGVSESVCVMWTVKMVVVI